MGTCFGRCLFGKKTNCRSSSQQDDQQQTLVDDEDDDVGGGSGNYDHHTNLPNINFLYRIARRHGKNKSPPTRFIERFWAHHQDKRYSRLNKKNKNNFIDIPLQCLDPQLLFQTNSLNSSARIITTTTTTASSAALVTNQTITTANNNYFDHSSLTDTNNFSSFSGLNPSPASSSLDLEWEHEYHLNKQLGNNYQNQHQQIHHSNNQLQHQQPAHQFDSSWVIVTDQHFQSKYQFNQINHQNDSTATTSEDDDYSSMDFSNKMYTSNNNLSQLLMGNSDCGGVGDVVNDIGASGNATNSMGCTKRTSFFIVPTKCSSKRTIADSRTTSWSHISTPDSLEWDINGDDDEKFKSDDDLLDNETKELLQEIEWLKNRALNETGETLRINNDTAAVPSSSTISPSPLRSISMPDEGTSRATDSS